MIVRAVPIVGVAAGPFGAAAPGFGQEAVPTFESLLAHPVHLKPELTGVHPRVFVTASELASLRTRAKTTHKAEWQRALGTLVSLASDPAPPPGSQDRRAQNDVGLQIAGTSFAYAIEQEPRYLASTQPLDAAGRRLRALGL